MIFYNIEVIKLEFKRLNNETEEQLLWRIGQAKVNGLIDFDWSTIADIINKEFRSDESEYRTEAAYRKPYQQAKRFFDAGIFKSNSDSQYIQELRQTKQELRKEKQKLFDERTELNRKLRNEARIENDLAHLETLISEKSIQKLQPYKKVEIDSENDLIICISDFHLGISNNNTFGSYNSDIAMDRLVEYYSNIEKIAKDHQCKNAYIVFLGDLINGEIHLTSQLENRENLTEQVQKAAEMLSDFTYLLSGIFENVYVNGVAGNHSRTSYKDEVLRGNKLDNLIPWYMKAALKHIDNVTFIDEHNYDATIGRIEIRGKEYLLVHGDYDQFNEAGVSKLVMMIGHKPCSILMGHMHHNSYDDISGVKIIRSGSFAGTGDDDCITKRLYGSPSQMAIVVDSSGIKCCYPIDL